MNLRSAAIFTALLGSACAGPGPVLYPNAHFEQVGKNAADVDVEECRQLADAAGAHRDPGTASDMAKRTAGGAAVGAVSGAVGGAIVGSAGSGSAIGAASGATAALLSSLFAPKPVGQAHMAFVNRCLAERGYESIGWE